MHCSSRRSRLGMSLTISKIKASAAGCDRARTTELSCVAGRGGSVAGWGKGDPCPVCGGDEVLASWACKSVGTEGK